MPRLSHCVKDQQPSPVVGQSVASTPSTSEKPKKHVRFAEVSPELKLPLFFLVLIITRGCTTNSCPQALAIQIRLKKAAGKNHDRQLEGLFLGLFRSLISRALLLPSNPFVTKYTFADLLYHRLHSPVLPHLQNQIV